LSPNSTSNHGDNFGNILLILEFKVFTIMGRDMNEGEVLLWIMVEILEDEVVTDKAPRIA